MNKISGGSAKAAQGVALFFFIPFLSFLSYLIVSKNFTKEGMMFLIPVLIISTIIIRRSFSCADIYKEGKFFVIKKLFQTKKVIASDIKEIGETLWPFTYFIIVDKKKILFFSSTNDLLKEITSSNIKVGLENMKSKFIKNEDEY